MAKIVKALALLAGVAKAAVLTEDPLKDGGDAYCNAGHLCDRCEGDCDYDTDCKGDLKCFQRVYTGKVPGCKDGQDTPTQDYCYKEVCESHKCPAGFKHKNYLNDDVSDANCCEASCAHENVKCEASNMITKDNPESIHASGATHDDVLQTCCDATCKSWNTKPTPAANVGHCSAGTSLKSGVDSTKSPSQAVCCEETCKSHTCPSGKRLKVGVEDKDISGAADNAAKTATCCEAKNLLQNLGDFGCNANNKCEDCQGDCDFDGDCQSGKCHQRDLATNTVPGCDNNAGDHNVPTHDYCVSASARLYSVDSAVATNTPTRFSVFPALAGVAMVTLVAFILIRTRKSSVRESQLAEGTSLVEEGEDTATLE